MNFERLSAKVSDRVAHPAAFASAVAIVVGWASFGPVTGYSEQWQLVINSSTTIATFLIAFLIQADQHRNSKALHAKVDELIRAVEGARNEMMGVEKRSEKEIEERRA